MVMYTMKQVCEKTGMTYEGLKFYCNQGLVPQVERDDHNHRVFDEAMVHWIDNLNCLKKCNLTLAEMKQYMAWCIEGKPSIPERKAFLAIKRQELVQKKQELEASIAYIDKKEVFYNDVLDGAIPYHSLLIKDDDEPSE